ncbi:hypothetical protein VTK56DRAFT_3488 [Thermocarpiscus australiensis]
MKAVGEYGTARYCIRYPDLRSFCLWPPSPKERTSHQPGLNGKERTTIHGRQCWYVLRNISRERAAVVTVVVGRSSGSLRLCPYATRTPSPAAESFFRNSYN